MGTHAVASDAPLARGVPTARGVGQPVRAPAAVDDGGRPAALAAVGAVQAVRRGRPRVRVEGVPGAQRLHGRPGLAQRRRDRPLPRLPRDLLRLGAQRRRGPGPRRQEGVDGSPCCRGCLARV